MSDNRVLSKSGGPVPVDRSHTEIDQATGQQRDYVILTAEERAKGFVRPVRRQYIHLACNTETRIAQVIAETYARDPKFYSSTFCVHCNWHFKLIDDAGKPAFVWTDDSPLHPHFGGDVKKCAAVGSLTMIYKARVIRTGGPAWEYWINDDGKRVSVTVDWANKQVQSGLARIVRVD
jgi:hypothetical protein